MVKSALPSPNTPLVGSDGKITSAWFQYFQNEHNRTGGNSTDLIAQLGDQATASGQFQVVPGSPSAGAEATIDFEVRAGTDSDFSNASLKMSALAGGGSRIELDADSVLVNGTPLSDGAIDTGMLGSGAATGHWDVEDITSTSVAAADTWYTKLTLNVTGATGEPIEIGFSVVAHNADTGGAHIVHVRVLRGATVVWPQTQDLAQTCTTDVAMSGALKDQPAAGDYVYTLQYKSDSTSVAVSDAVMTADEIRR